MSLIEMFLVFAEKIMKFEVMGITIYSYLITFAILIFIFNIIKILSNSNKSAKATKKSKGSE